MPSQSSFVPDRLWSWIPSSWDAWDVAFTRRMKSGYDIGSPFWKAVDFFSNSALGTSFLVVAVLALICIKPPRLKESWQGLARHAALLVMVAVVCDLIAYRLLKFSFGRLKPGTGVFDGSGDQALGFPSSHAVNLSFLWGFLRWNVVDAKRWRLEFALALIFVLLVAYSRVIFGAHYFLDVVAGITFGFGFSSLLRRQSRKLWQWSARR